jgi:FixJ family two-component response regulator
MALDPVVNIVDDDTVTRDALSVLQAHSVAEVVRYYSDVQRHRLALNPMSLV